MKSIRFIRLPEVKSQVGLSTSTIYARIKNGAFPAPIPIGGRLVAWNEVEIQDWIKAQLANQEK